MKLLQLSVAVVFSLAVSAHADIITFDNQADFQMAAASSNSFLMGVEDFEGAVFPDDAVAAFQLPDPILKFGVPNVNPDGSGFPNGLTVPNVVLEAIGLVVQGPDFGGSGASTVSLSPLSTNVPLILSFSNAPITAVGFNIGEPLPSDVRDASVLILDTNGQVLFDGVYDFLGTPLDNTFLGFQATGGRIIGSITLSDAFAPTIDNIQVWQVPEPSSAVIGVLGLVGLIGRRRR